MRGRSNVCRVSLALLCLSRAFPAIGVPQSGSDPEIPSADSVLTALVEEYGPKDKK
jgi:hypothetical protein